ncbi:formyltetrahydrofolate hydrolase [Paraburkholderia sp. GAS334]
MPATDRPHQFALTLDCPSAAGQVAAVVGFLDRHHCYIDELAVFDDDISSRFFVRCVFHGVGVASDATLHIDALRREFSPIAADFRMNWAIHDIAARPKVLIMVSKLEHCLADLLFRWRMGELKMDIVGIGSNHPDFEPLAVQHGLPFWHLPVSAETRDSQEAQMLDLFESPATPRWSSIHATKSCRATPGIPTFRFAERCPLQTVPTARDGNGRSTRITRRPAPQTR